MNVILLETGPARAGSSLDSICNRRALRSAAPAAAPHHDHARETHIETTNEMPGKTPNERTGRTLCPILMYVQARNEKLRGGGATQHPQAGFMRFWNKLWKAN
jgi:hypothetical protein